VGTACASILLFLFVQVIYTRYLRIFVVDDEPEIASALELILNSAGFSSHCFHKSTGSLASGNAVHHLHVSEWCLNARGFAAQLSRSIAKSVVNQEKGKPSEEGLVFPGIPQLPLAVSESFDLIMRPVDVCLLADEHFTD
jgi:hypothetical protein